jgi:hypothetical protein
VRRLFAGWFVLTFIGVAAMLAALAWTVMVLITPPPAKMFRTTKFEMRLAKDWSCDQEGSTYVCSPGARDAEGVFAMKRRGSMDGLAQYRDHLSKPKTWTDPNGASHTSRVSSLEIVRLAGRAWISSLHYESEVPGFYTLYLGTVTTDAGIMVTFSARRDTYEKRKPELEDMVDSLMVYQL